MAAALKPGRSQPVWGKACPFPQCVLEKGTVHSLSLLIIQSGVDKSGEFVDDGERA